MKILFTLCIICAVVSGTFAARHTDIDINRVKRISEEVPLKHVKQSVQGLSGELRRTNDYEDHSSWYAPARAPLPAHGAPTSADQKPAIQFYQPREDPRNYYQSDAYLKDTGIRNRNEEAIRIYPRDDVVRADESNPGIFARLREDIFNPIKDSNTCVKCPHDRTLVAKPYLGKVVLKTPHLQACSGRKAPRSAKFVHLYGPKFGSLLGQGSHMVIGQIVDKNKNLQLCKMQVHVVAQGCVPPKFLTTKCWDKQCNFTCKNSNLELSGPTTQTCGDDLKWQGELPVCKAPTWCEYPSPPERGRIACRGKMAGAGLAEGASCRVRCDPGWRAIRGSVCRHGAWTQKLSCKPGRTVLHRPRLHGPQNPLPVTR